MPLLLFSAQPVGAGAILPRCACGQTDVAVLRRTRERLMGSQRFTELARIPIRVGPPSEHGGLAPLMTGDTLLLRSRVPKATSAPIGVNVDSLLLLDALEDGTVFEVEVLVPRRAWSSNTSAPRPPPGVDKGSIVIADPGQASMWISSRLASPSTVKAGCTSNSSPQMARHGGSLSRRSALRCSTGAFFLAL